MAKAQQTFLVDEKNNAFVFDVCLAEEHEDESEVTEHPVEEGADVTDNVRRKTVTLNLDILHSNYPIYDGTKGRLAFELGQSSDAVFAPRPGAMPESVKDPNIRGLELTEAFRAEACYAQMVAWKNSATILKAYTPLLQNLVTLYKKAGPSFTFLMRNFVIKTISTRKGPNTGGMVDMQLGLKEIRFVSNRRVEVQEAVVPVQDNGTQESKPAPPAVDARARSYVLQGTQKVLLGVKMDSETRVTTDETPPEGN